MPKSWTSKASKQQVRSVPKPKPEPKTIKIPVVEAPVPMKSVVPKIDPVPVKPPVPPPKSPKELPFFNFIKIPLGAYNSRDALPLVNDTGPEMMLKLALSRGYRYDCILPAQGGYVAVLIRETASEKGVQPK